MHRVLIQKQDKVEQGTLSDIKSSATVWADLINPTEEELKELEKYTEIEAHHIKEWMIGKKKPAAIDFQNYSVLIILAPTDERCKDCKHIVAAEPCVMLISHDLNDFITIHRHNFPAIKDVENYPEKHKSAVFRERATFLLFTLLNEIIEHYYDALDMINETVQKAEELALNPRPEKSLMRQVLASKKSMIYFHKALLANREVIMMIENEHLGFLEDSMMKEFRILSSSITQLIEINSTYRDILNTATEIHLTVISNGVNTTMKKVTSWGAIILIPSLVASIFGMNFEHFDAFKWQYGLEISFGIMGISVLLLYWFFKRRDWI